MITVFMAEDDPLMVSIYERAFRVAGFDLRMGLDGEKALTSITNMNPKPSVILLDIMMPKKDGFAVLKDLKASDELKNIPVIILSNLAGDADKEKGLALGAEMYLVKSQFSSKDLAVKVQEVYNKYKK